MFVVVVGGGRVGSELTSDLINHGHKVRLVENRPKVLEQLHREIPTQVIHVGDPTIPRVLEAAGIESADVVATVLSKDVENLAVANYARYQYQVPRIIARVNNPRCAWLFTKQMGVDVALNQVDIVGNLIQEEMSLGDMMTLLKIRRGRYSLVEQKIPPGAQAVGVAIMDLDLPRDCLIAAVIRRGELVIPRGPTKLEIGDEVLALTDNTGALRLADLLSPQE